MGRPRKPVQLLELNGSLKKHPDRRRNPGPNDPRPFGDPPDRLPAEIRPYWLELTSMTAPGVLAISDRWAVELAARLYFKAVNEPDIPAILELAATAGLSPAETKRLIRSQMITGNELSNLRSLLASLGLTPADREKLSIPTEKPVNKFALLKNEVTH